MATHDFRPGSPHVINRATLFDDIMSLYTKELLEVVVEYPICMCLEDEMAVDAGGVARDVFSQFFSEAYLHLFDGSSLLYPAVHASVSMATFPTLGAITSHAYLATGVFPDRVAFPWMVLHSGQLAILARPYWSSQVRTHHCQHSCQSSVLCR